MPNDEITPYRLTWCPAETHGDRAGTSLLGYCSCGCSNPKLGSRRATHRFTDGRLAIAARCRSRTTKACFVCAQNISHTVGLTALHLTVCSNTLVADPKCVVVSRAAGTFLARCGLTAFHSNHVAQHQFSCRCTSYSLPEASFAVQWLRIPRRGMEAFLSRLCMRRSAGWMLPLPSANSRAPRRVSRKRKRQYSWQSSFL